MVSDLLDAVRAGSRVPRHVAIVMDGNGRWAESRGLVRHLGHGEGMKAVRESVEASLAAGVEILTLFLFSISTEALGWDFMGILIGSS